MKIYTQTFDVAKQSPKRFWVAPFSDFKIGVKIVKNGTPIDNEFTVKKGTTTLTPDEDLVDGFKTYTIKSGATGFEEYTVEISGVGEAQKLTQIITDSTVFDVGAGGGDVPEDVATQSWVENYVSAETSAFVTASDVETAISTATTDMATQTWVGQQGYASQSDLSIYATTSAMESYVSTATSNFITSSALTPYAKSSDVASTYATKVELSDYATTSAMTSAISAATSNKVTGGAIGLAPVVSSAVAVYASVWASMSASADANTLYVVLSDPS